MNKDIEQLRKELEEDSCALAFAGGCPAAMLEVSDIESASDEEIIRMAKERGLI